MFGFNKDGLLGLSDKSVLVPTTVPFTELSSLKVLKVSCGFKHAVMLATPDDGKTCMIYASGSNKRGQLGLDVLGEQINQFAPIVADNETHQTIRGKILDVQCSWHNTLVITQETCPSGESDLSGTLHCYITGDNKYG